MLCFYCSCENRHKENCPEEVTSGEEREHAIKAWGRGVTAGDKGESATELDNPYYMLGMKRAKLDEDAEQVLLDDEVQFSDLDKALLDDLAWDDMDPHDLDL